MDVGSNCGYSSLYFLTRNKDNNVICYEPDRKNLDFLRTNLKAFKNRSSIRNVGIAVESGYAEFYLTSDGKYNSLLEMKDYDEKVTIELVNFNDEIDKCSDRNSLIIKIDVEGIEKNLIKEIDFENKENVSKLIIESNDCSRFISRKHKRILVNGYVEHIIFQ
jgi:FkbM family methyltransferase